MKLTLYMEFSTTATANVTKAKNEHMETRMQTGK